MIITLSLVLAVFNIIILTVNICAVQTTNDGMEKVYVTSPRKKHASAPSLNMLVVVPTVLQFLSRDAS